MTSSDRAALGLPADAAAPRRRRRWWSVVGSLVGVGALVWIGFLVDLDRLRAILAEARIEYLLLVPLAIALEQLVRAWKWRQLLHDLRPIPTLRLFGAIMAGYLGNLLVPLGLSPLVRAWLVARLDDLRTKQVHVAYRAEAITPGDIETAIGRLGYRVKDAHHEAA